MKGNAKTVANWGWVHHLQGVHFRARPRHPFLFFPFSKTVWLALDLYLQPPAPEGTARPSNDEGYDWRLAGVDDRLRSPR